MPAEGGGSSAEAPSCPVCLSPYERHGRRKRKILHCIHSLCLDCLRRIQDQSIARCPLCNTPHDVPVGGVRVFPTYTAPPGDASRAKTRRKAHAHRKKTRKLVGAYGPMGTGDAVRTAHARAVPGDVAPPDGSARREDLGDPVNIWGRLVPRKHVNTVKVCCVVAGVVLLLVLSRSGCKEGPDMRPGAPKP